MGATGRLAVAGVRRRGIGQVVVLVLIAALAAAAVVAGLASRTSTADLIDAAYERAGRPDLILRGTPEALRAAAEDPEVAAASEPAPQAFGETVIDGDPVDVFVRAVDPAALPAVGAPALVDGRWPTSAEEIVVERSTVVEGATSLGATMRIANPSGDFDVRVVGTAIELSDCFYTNQQCDPLRTFGPTALVDRMNANTIGATHMAAYRLVRPDAAPAVGSRLLRDIGAGGGIFSQNSWPDTRGDILVIGEVFGAMVAGFGAFLLAAACFVVAGATAARLVARRRSLGLLRAVGFRPRQVLAAVLLEHLVIGAAGVAVGWVLGSLAAPALGDVDTVLDTSASTFEVGPLLIAFVLVEAFLALAVILPAWRAGRQPATEVLRDVPPMPGGGRSVAAVARRLGAGPSLVAGLRRAVARPVRAGLAAAAVLVAAVGSIVAAGFIGSVEHAVDDPASVGVPWNASALGPVDADLPALLDGTPEVAAWYTERETHASVGDGTFLTLLLGGDPDAAGFRVQEGDALRGPGEALVGYGFLQETGLEVGDPFEATINGATVPLRIVGWYLDTTDAGKVLLVRGESLGPALFDEDSVRFRIVAADGVSDDELAAAVATRAGERAFVLPSNVDDGGLGAITGTLYAFAALLAGVAAANLAATTVASTRERARALGVLRTVGCTTGQLVGQSAAGSALLGFAAGVVGVPVGWLVFRWLSDTITSGVGVGPGLAIAPPWWFLAAVVPAATLLSAGAGALASWGLSRRPAAELVRYE